MRLNVTVHDLVNKMVHYKFMTLGSGSNTTDPFYVLPVLFLRRKKEGGNATRPTLKMKKGKKKCYTGTYKTTWSPPTSHQPCSRWKSLPACTCPMSTLPVRGRPAACVSNADGPMHVNSRAHLVHVFAQRGLVAQQVNVDPSVL